MEPSAGDSSGLSAWREPAAGGSSKQKVNDTGDDEISSSVHKVCSNNDLLIEILLRLPLISLHLFKSVCKRWLSLITDPSFTLLRSRNPNIDPPSGFFLQRDKTSSEFDFVPLDARIPVKTSPLKSTFTFGLDSGHVELLQFCNGLLLCCIRPDKFYVYNPTTNLVKLLPLPHLWEPRRFISGMGIAFDPALSSHYKVLYPVEVVNDGCSVHLEIYSSEKGNWKVCAQRFPFECFESFDNGIYWHDSIHWIDYTDKVLHFKLEMENLHFIDVETPASVTGKLDPDDKLLESGDCLLLVKMVHPPSLQMNVYEMNNDYSGWSIMYHVDLDDIRTECPGNLKYFPKHFMFFRKHFIVRAIVLGGSEEEPFLVVEVPGMLMQYYIISKTFYELCELVPIRRRVTNFCSFQFIASLAGV